MADLNEAEIQLLLNSDLVLRDRLDWVVRGVRIRTRAKVENSLGEQVTLDFHISTRAAEAYSLVLLWRNRPLRRLDVRGTHRDQTGLVNESWDRRTHKHAYRDGLELGLAYTPDDLPDTSTSLVADEYRAVFEAFCKEINIDLDYEWTDPPTSGGQSSLPVSGQA